MKVARFTNAVCSDFTFISLLEEILDQSFIDVISDISAEFANWSARVKLGIFF